MLSEGRRDAGTFMESVLGAVPAIAFIAAMGQGAAARAAAGEAPDGGARHAAAAAAAIGGSSVCPGPDAVLAELERLVPRDRLDARLRSHGDAPVEIVDLGAPY